MPDPRQINEQQKQAVLERQGLHCFIDYHPINLDELEFDHIHPYVETHNSTVNEIAAVCGKNNREKGTLSLSEYRDRLGLRRFFEGAKKRRLDDLLMERLTPSGFGRPISYEVKEDEITVFLETGSKTFPLFRCPATDEKYFFIVLPISLIKNDVDLQPRTLEPDRLWELYRRLLTHTQLAPAVCRLVGHSVLLFDGQHKAAAQVWAGRDRLDCKIYIEPEVTKLKETNLTAHDKLRQMPFYTSTLLEKYAGLASEDWQAFLETPSPKTEANFVDFMRLRKGLSRAESVKRVRAKIYEDILDQPNNLLREYITEENRGRQNPLTIARLQKTFFAEFIASPPLQDEFETDSYHRPEELENIVRLFNLVVKRSLEGKWAPERNDAEHKKAARLYSAGALRAWVPMLRDALVPWLGIVGKVEMQRILYRPLDDMQFQHIERILDKLFSHRVWMDPNPELNDLRYDNADRATEMLSREGLTGGWLAGLPNNG